MEYMCDIPSVFMPNSNETTDLEKNLRSFASVYRYYHGYLCVAVCVFGIVNNVFNTLVLTQPSMRTSINIILAAVAVCDTGTMTSYLAYVIHFYVLQYPGRCLEDKYTKGWLYFILFHSLWSILLHTTSLWLAVLLAFMRLVVIRKHYMSHSFLDAKNVWKMIMVIFVPLMILCGPIFLTTVVEEARGATTCAANSTAVAYTTRPSDLALNRNCLLLRITLWINGLLFKLLPCLLLAILICLLLWTFNKAKKRNTRVLKRSSCTAAAIESASVLTATAARSTLAIPNLLVTQHSGTRVQQVYKSAYTSRTTKMLAAILLIFLLTEIPQAVLATLSGFSPSDIYFHIYPYLGDVLDMLALINSSINFILYCTMSSRFRSTFVQLFVPRRLLTIRRWSASSNSEANQTVDLAEAENRRRYLAQRTGRSSPQIFAAQANGVEHKVQINESQHLLSVPDLNNLCPPTVDHDRHAEAAQLLNHA